MCRKILTFHRFPHSLHSTKVVMGSSALRVWTCGERLHVTFLLVSCFNGASSHLRTSFQTSKWIKDLSEWAQKCGALCVSGPPSFSLVWLKCTNTCVTYWCVTLRLIVVFMMMMASINTPGYKRWWDVITAYLSVSAVLALAFSTDEHVSLRAAHFGELMLSNWLLGQRFPDLFQLCACHLLPNTCN